MAAQKDTFANQAAVRVLETGPAAQTTTKFAFPFSIMDRIGLIISRIEYWFPSFVSLNSANDIVYCGLVTNATITDLANQSDPLIIDIMSVTRTDIGTAASGALTVAPIIKDFSALPGGGLLVAPSPLYAIIQGVGTTPAIEAYVKLFYTYMEMKPDEYWQLVESRRIISN